MRRTVARAAGLGRADYWSRFGRRLGPGRSWAGEAWGRWGPAGRSAGPGAPGRGAGPEWGRGGGARSPPDGGSGRGCQLGAWRGLRTFPRESITPVRPPPLPAASPPVFGAAGTVRRSRSSFVFVSLSPSSYWKLESDGGENKPLA